MESSFGYVEFEFLSDVLLDMPIGLEKSGLELII